jgi:hypothetical protein
VADFEFEKRSFLSRLWPKRPSVNIGLIGRIALGLVVLVALYIPVGMAWVHVIDDDTTLAPTEFPAGGSRAVAMAATLIERETITHRWTANDPFFLPGWWLDNMPEFQTGMIEALGRFTTEMMDQIGRNRGSSQADPDLSKAVDLLKSSPDVWLFDFATSWAPTTSSDAKYRSAAKALRQYNQRLSQGQALFERRGDNLIALLERITSDLGSASAILDRQIIEGSDMFIDRRADNIFYGVKGRLYGYYLILRELGVDYQQLLRDREAFNAWTQMLESLHEASLLNPLIVMNGSTESLFVANHLTTQGFYLLRARTQVREVSEILIR